MTNPSLDKMIELVELNIGRLKPEAVGIVDVKYGVWGEKGSFPMGTLDHYKKFPLSDMHRGDSIHNNNTFLMKVTEKTGIIVVMSDLHTARLAAINLREHLNALSDFYKLEKSIKKR
ncbi:MAG: hypothetical protein WED07_14065 [Candidatus Freyarchaeum deiterrae]